VKRKLIFSLVALVLITTTLLAACAAPTPTTAPTSAPPTTTAAPKVIELTFNDHNPPDMPVSNAIIAYGKYIEEKSAGKVKVNVVIGGALLQADEAMRGVQTGVVDAATYILNKMDGFYLNDIITLPFMGWPSRDGTTAIYKALFQKFPEMGAEWKGVTYRTFAMMPPVQMHWTKKQVTKPADVKGVKSFCAEAIYTETYAALGGVPVDLDIADMFTSVERGVVDGVVNHAPVCFVFGALDLLKSHTYFGQGGISMAPVGIIWNNDRYNSLPADVKKVVDDAGQFYYDSFMEQEIGFNAMVEGIMRDRKDYFADLTPDQIAVWRDAIKPVIHSKWLNEAKAKGLPAQAVYDEVLKLAATTK
jgi:TRAP-type C4-dicarboxylate transport system substrate-binding protein